MRTAEAIHSSIWRLNVSVFFQQNINMANPPLLPAYILIVYMSQKHQKPALGELHINHMPALTAYRLSGEI